MVRHFCKVLLLLTGTIACSAPIIAWSAPPDVKQRHDAWQELLEHREFHFPKRLSVLDSLRLFSADCKVHLIYDPKYFDITEYKFVRDGRELLSLEGHSLSAFANEGDRLYFANYGTDTTGCDVATYDLSTGKKLWQTELSHAKAGAHSAYANSVTLWLSRKDEIKGEEAGSAVIVTGSESYCDYVEVLDSKTGEMLALKNYRTGFGPPPGKAGGKPKKKTECAFAGNNSD